TSTFDAVDQRRHHAFRPHRGFHPGPVTVVSGFCTLCSQSWHSRCSSLPRHGSRASTFLPPSLGAALLSARLAAHHRCSTMRALTPVRRSHAEQASSLTPLCLPDIQPPTTSCARAPL